MQVLFGIISANNLTPCGNISSEGSVAPGEPGRKNRASIDQTNILYSQLGPNIRMEAEHEQFCRYDFLQTAVNQ